MTRRSAISLALGGLAGLPGCRPPETPPPVPETPATPTQAPEVLPSPKEIEGRELVPVTVGESLVIRTIGGLRPFRPSGFVVRKEERGDKKLIHNYGHGGGGVTLSWGSAELAVRLAGAVAGTECAVVGGGVMGLSTARLLQSRGASVTLYAEALPPDTTSNVAGAQWWPFSVFDEARRTEAFGAQYVEAARFSFRYFQGLVGARWGVRWLPNYYLSGRAPGNGWIAGPGGVLHDLQIGFRDFGPGEHVFPAAYARRFHTMMIEPATYLATLLRDVRAGGAGIEIRRFATGDDVLRLPAPVIFNCTGLGAGALFGDPELVPVKGQLSFLLPQPGVDYNLISDDLYMFPRSDGIVLGGSYERGEWDPTPDEAVRRRIVRGHRALFEGMRRIRNEHG